MKLLPCSDCGAENPEQAKFCLECGKPLPRTCAHCGSALPAQAKFCPQCAHPVGAPQPSAPMPERAAERRQLTILFCDLVGSTALARRLDPERLRELMQQYQRACGEVVQRYEGHVAQYLGDGLMVYFGFPRAHEDDAERAVRAALEIIEAVRALPTMTEPLQVRLGIATGAVVVGDTGAGDASVPRLAVGETPNVAARLQGLAGPDEIVVAPSTQRLLGAMFELRDRGEQALKGIVEPVRAWQVLGLARVEGRFAAARGEAELTPWVGRESELGLLLDRWSQACAGEGQLVLIGGEAGIGKSRIAHALHERITGQAHQWWVYQCSPFHTQSALHPVIAHLEATAGFGRADCEQTKLDKLDALLGARVQGTQTAALLASLLGLSTQRHGALNYSPQKQKDLLLEALVNDIVRISQSAPVLMLVEDVHWVDPTTQEAIDMLASRLATQRVLLILTHRPEYAARWSGEAHVSQLSLSRLNRRLAADLALKVSAGRTLSAQALEQIVAKTDGVPLFVEELTKAVLEAGAHTDLARAVPNTLHDSLMARLDRLPEVKRIAQLGACIGRVFDYELLAAIGEEGQGALEKALAQLEAAGLLFRQGSGSRASYTFKHALVQDVAYESLLKSRRQEVHGRLVDALEGCFPDRVKSEPEVIAAHCTAAGRHEAAARYWQAAAQQALGRFANAEAEQRAMAGLRALEQVAASAARDQLELELLLSAGVAQFSVYGFAHETAGRTYARASELSERVGTSPQQFVVIYGLWVFFFVKAEYSASGHFVDTALRYARDLASPIYRVCAQTFATASALVVGNLRDSHAYGIAAVDGYNPDMAAESFATFGINAGADAMDWASWSLCLLGQPDAAKSLQRRGMALARADAEPNTVAQLLAHTSVVDFFRDDFQQANANAMQTIQISEHHGMPLRLAEGHILQGWARSEMGEGADSIVQIEHGIELWNRIGARIANTVWFSALARAHWNVGHLVNARTSLNRALAEMERTGERLLEVELHRLNGKLLLAEDATRVAQAQACFERALEVAQAQSNRLHGLRAAVSLGRLWQRQERAAQAVELVKPLYDAFTEGFDSADLVRARQLLDEVGS